MQVDDNSHTHKPAIAGFAVMLHRGRIRKITLKKAKTMKDMKPDLFAAMTKANKEMNEKLTEEEEERAKELLEARAEKELGNMQGSKAGRMALLMAIDGIEDDEQRKAAFAALRTPEGLVPENKGEGTADEELDGLAKAYQVANPGTTVEAAHAAVLTTPEGAVLYAKTLN